MAEMPTCPKCGAELPRDALQGLCPLCLGQVVFGISEASADSVIGEKPGDRIGPYKLLQEIGEGGCGVVYMAEQEEPIRRRVALKIIKLGMDTKEVIGRLEVERQALAMMDHPNIAKVFDAGATESGRPYFVMELVGGMRITDYCDQHHLPTAARLALFVQVCHALQHAHQKGIIHRDIKPSNILVSVHDDVPVPKVIDFGIAKAIGQRLTDKTLFTRFEQFIGTPCYMSPEQAGVSHLDIDTRSDIYALGVLLYELLTGCPPFDPKQFAQAGLEEILRRIREEEPPRPSTRLRGLRPDELTTTAQRRQTEPPKLISLLRGDLDWIVMKCLEKNRARRYATADALALDLEHHLNHQPVSAAAPTLRYRLSKFTRRHWRVLATMAAFAMLLVTGTVVSVVEAVRANQACMLAEQREAEARENLWASYLTAARASRTSGRPGRRFEALEAVAKAAGIRPAPELRSEAASALALVDVRTLREWAGNPVGKGTVALDPTFERYARCDSPDAIGVRRVSDDRELVSFACKGSPVRFSPDGRFLVVNDGWPPANYQVWNLDTGRAVLEATVDVGYTPGLDFQPQEPVVAVCGPAHEIQFFDLTTGRRWSWPPTNDVPAYLRFRHDGKQLAISSWSGPSVRVYEADSGKLVATLTHSNVTGALMDWSPDGRWLAASCTDGRLNLWDMEQGGRLDCRLEAHEAPATTVAFDPQGEFLLSQGWDNTTALWSLPLRSLVMKLPGCECPLSFSADGRRLGPFQGGRTVRVLEVARAPEYRVLPARTGPKDCNGAFSPDARWLVLGGAGLQCWEVRTGQRLWTEPVGYVRYVMFRPNLAAPLGGSTGEVQAGAAPAGSAMLFTIGEAGAREWPWRVEAATGVPRLGQPRQLTGGATAEAACSRDGSVLVVSQPEGLWISHPRASKPILLPMPVCNFVTVSPDGRWVAAAPWNRREMKVWELPDGREVYYRTNANPALAFTCNGRWLLMAWADFYECLEVGTWRSVAQVPHDWELLFALAPSPDSRWVAFGHGRGPLLFREVPAFRPILTLDTAAEYPDCFSPDGGLLLTRRAGGHFGLWDVRRIREKLAPLGLDW